MGAFFGGPAEPTKAVDAVLKVLEDIKSTSAGKNISKWGVLGLCWGGKVYKSL